MVLHYWWPRWLFALSFFLVFCTLKGQIRMASDFENGNGLLVQSDFKRNVVSFLPAVKSRDRDLIWFHFVLSGFRKDTVFTLRLPFQKASFAPDPILIQDQDQWHRVSAEENGFYKTYRYLCRGDSIRVATGVPYSPGHLNQFLEKFSGKPGWTQEVLCTTEGGRPVPMLRFQPPGGKPKGTIFLIARQHAFEAPSGFFMEGALSAWLEDSPEGRELRRQYALLAVPMMDVDNVDLGATGKDQFPRDINRDWVDHPHWKGVAAVQALLRQSETKTPLLAAFDFHAPYPIYKKGSHFYKNGPDTSAMMQRLQAFMDIHSLSEGYRLLGVRNNRIKTGELNFNRFIQECRSGIGPCFPKLLFSTTYEQSWQNKPDGTPYTELEIRASGERLMRSLGRYLSLH
jgi:hypothetical protein